MPSYFILVPILLPVIAGILLLVFPIEDARKRNICIEIIVVINTLLVLWLLTHRPSESFYMFSLGARLPLTLNVDGLAMFFAGLVACLWPLASLYAFEYMKHEERVNTFMAFYTITYGVTLGVAFAGNIITMYLFYECLTMVTLPLVIHTMTREARVVWAARKTSINYRNWQTSLAVLLVVQDLQWNLAGSAVHIR